MDKRPNERLTEHEKSWPALKKRKAPKPKKPHREWFDTLAKKKCPQKTDKCQGPVYSWGEYHAARYRVIKHFCQGCFIQEVLSPLKNHVTSCKCSFEFVMRGYGQLPEFLAFAQDTLNGKF